MKKQMCVALILWSSAGAASDQMTLEEAVARLMKDFEGSLVVPGSQHRMSPQAVGTSQQKQSHSQYGPSTSGTYTVKRGETLDRVIRKLAPNSELRLSMLRRAFVQANPHAFRRNNPNWLYSGVVLKVPDLDDLRRVIFKDSGNSLKKNISDEKAGWVRFP